MRVFDKSNALCTPIGVYQRRAGCGKSSANVFVYPTESYVVNACYVFGQWELTLGFPMNSGFVKLC